MDWLELTQKNISKAETLLHSTAAQRVPKVQRQCKDFIALGRAS
jgi:hypothetical protein